MPRSTWTAEVIRAKDLTDQDIVLIDDTWREILDIWHNDDDPATEFGEDSSLTKSITPYIGYDSACWVVVRFVKEETSSGRNVASGFRPLRLHDLVHVQKRVSSTTKEN